MSSWRTTTSPSPACALEYAWFQWLHPTAHMSTIINHAQLCSVDLRGSTTPTTSHVLQRLIQERPSNLAPIRTTTCANVSIFYNIYRPSFTLTMYCSNIYNCLRSFHHLTRFASSSPRYATVALFARCRTIAEGKHQRAHTLNQSD
jgi:hypothetical protein